MIVEDLLPLAKPIEQFKLLPGNPRRGDVTAVAASLDAFGQRKPIVALPDGTVIAGNHTLQAAQQLGWDQIAVVVVQDDDVTAKAYALADNRTAELGGYDDDLLAELIAQVANEDELLFAATGWDIDELAGLLDDPAESYTDPDEVPEPPRVAVTKPGDVWLLGRHRVVCGDATDPASWELATGGKRATLCFTSPPYNAGDSALLRKTSRGGFYNEHTDDLNDTEYLALLNAFTAQSLSHADTTVVNVQMIQPNKVAIIDYMAAQRAQINDVAIWNKGDGAPCPAAGVMTADFEFLLFMSNRGNTRRIPTATFQGTVRNVYNAPPQRRNEFADIHGATFPAHLPAWVIGNFDGTGSGSIIDCFAGTGTTIIAAHDAGRTAYGIELDPIYVDVTCRRFQEHTGVVPVLEATGEEHDFSD